MAEVLGRIRLRGPAAYFTRLGSIIEFAVVCSGLASLIYSIAVDSTLAAQVYPYFTIIGKNVWEYCEMLQEEKELRQTKARACEEVAFGNLEEPVQIEMEPVGNNNKP